MSLEYEKIAFDRLLQRSYNDEQFLADFRVVYPSLQMTRKIWDMIRPRNIHATKSAELDEVLGVQSSSCCFFYENATLL